MTAMGHITGTYQCSRGRSGEVACASETGFTPRVYLVQRNAQPDSCLAGLLRYAERISERQKSAEFADPSSLLRWLRAQRVVLDAGSGRQESGCNPAQRSEIWPEFGMNCWEATAHFLGVAIRQRWPVEIFVFDALVNGQRHVFPAWRALGSQQVPVPLVLQPPIRTGKSAVGLTGALAQGEWYNDVLGAFHFVGDKVLRVFGAGGAADELAKLEGDALPDWARTDEQKQQYRKLKEEEAKRKAAGSAVVVVKTGTAPPGSPLPGAPPVEVIPAKVTVLPANSNPEALDARVLLEQVNRLTQENQALRRQTQQGA